MSRYVSPQRHQWMDPWRSGQGPAFSGLCAQVSRAIEDQEQTERPRQRKRRKDDETNYRNGIEVLVANLAHAVLLPPETGRLAFGLSNGNRTATRYDNRALGKTFTTTLYAADALGMLDLSLSMRRGEATSFVPSEKFATAVRALSISLNDFRRQKGEEVVLLSSDGDASGKSGAVGRRALLDYADDERTLTMRADVEALNRHLTFADVSFLNDGLPTVDHSQRTAVRRFYVPAGASPKSFDCGGRLYGGFWQNLKRRRRAGIRIEGEPVAVLDFASMFPRLAYARAGVAPPEGDLYAIPGLEGHRAAVKKAMGTFMFDLSPRRSEWPLSLIEPEEVDQDPASLFPPEWTVGRVRKAILKRHPTLKDSFGQGLGHRLYRTESEVLIAVLNEMRGRRMLGLGLHDGLIVKASDAPMVKAMMEEIGRDMVGARLPVTLSLPAITPP